MLYNLNKITAKVWTIVTTWKVNNVLCMDDHHHRHHHHNSTIYSGQQLYLE